MDSKTAYEIAKTIPRTNESSISLAVFYNDNGTLRYISVFNHGTTMNNDYFDKIDGVMIYVNNMGPREKESEEDKLEEFRDDGWIDK